MPKFNVRYKVGHEPSDADDDGVVVVEAGGFKTQDKFIDFYAEAVTNVQGTLNLKGAVVYRVAVDVVADVRKVE